MTINNAGSLESKTSQSQEKFLLDAISYTDQTGYRNFLKKLTSDQAIAVLIYAAKAAQRRFAFSDQEGVLVETAAQRIISDANDRDPLRNFDWSRTADSTLKQVLQTEMRNRVYETVFSVKDGDTVVDLGASVGCFVHTILDRKFSKCYAIEPISYFHPAIKNNGDDRVQIIHGAISDEPEIEIEWDGQTETVQGINLQRLIDEFGIDRIDFLKMDCEGGEYCIFSQDNIEWIKQNCKYCVGEWHLSTPELKRKFKTVRDHVFPAFKRVEVFAVNGTPINEGFDTQEFIDYFSEIIIHIEV
jgi:FkbM family methyltransferase